MIPQGVIVPYRDVTTAKVLAERIPGIRSVAIQPIKGRKVLMLSAVVNGQRLSREVPVCNAGTVADASVYSALRGLGLSTGAFRAR